MHADQAHRNPTVPAIYRPMSGYSAPTFLRKTRNFTAMRT